MTTEVLADLNPMLRGAIDATHACYRATLAPRVLRDVCAGDVVRWISGQDESIDPARIVRQARLAYLYIHQIIPA